MLLFLYTPYVSSHQHDRTHFMFCLLAGPSLGTLSVEIIEHLNIRVRIRVKEGSVLFNDALNTFYLR